MKTWQFIFVFCLLFLCKTSFAQAKKTDSPVSFTIAPNEVRIFLKPEKSVKGLYAAEIRNQKGQTMEKKFFAVNEKGSLFSMSTLTLQPGNYDLLISRDEKLLQREEFSKDAILMEPQPAPVMHKD